MEAQDQEPEGPHPVEVAQEFVESVLAAMGTATEVKATHSEPDDSWTIDIQGEDADLLVGHEGEVLNALQYLTILATQRQTGEHIHLTIDADSYRARRKKALEETARSVADEVTRSGQEAELDPLNPYERRIIHNALLDHPGVRTYSEGEDPDRRVIIAPR